MVQLETRGTTPLFSVLPFQTQFSSLSYSHHYLSVSFWALSVLLCRPQPIALLSASVTFPPLRLIRETSIGLPCGNSDSVIKTHSASRDVSSLAESKASAENFLLYGETRKYVHCNFGCCCAHGSIGVQGEPESSYCLRPP